MILQSGLLVCHTSAEALGAIERPRTFPGDSEFVHLNCQLAGVFEGRVGKRDLLCQQGSLTVGYSAGENFRIRHCRSFRNVSVMVRPELLGELAGDHLHEALGAGLDPHFFVHCASACRKTIRSAAQLAGLLADASRHRLLLHAAALDFLYWHLAAFRRRDERKALSPRECRQLEDARVLLLSDPSAPPTIAELARAVGMNQCKLKTGFKQVYGRSIYALFQDARMSRARELLRSHNVTETAVLLGYTNISHFSSAFQKRFGCLPSRIRQST
ncbi:helix-turn-helix transcriptional regulator [Pseudothauera nasutitermitis]|uniref:helix-turn-helix transcriptional regulator n=1 Tax=Pseudothauera nasutitermitis TaxID=2565930 RepID=UPI001B3B28E1|nr:AraC family transcriptional regulator [Pseudothauera nasutitermitis]